MLDNFVVRHVELDMPAVLGDTFGQRLDHVERGLRAGQEETVTLSLTAEEPTGLRTREAPRLLAPATVATYTLTELGVPGVELGNWFGVFAPASTPNEVVARLGSEIAKAVAQPDVTQRFADLG